MSRDRRRLAVFQPEFREDLRFWVKTERSIAIRVLDLVEAVLRDPFEGPGKPEPLKYVLAGCWSRASLKNTAWCTGSPTRRSTSYRLDTTIEGGCRPSQPPQLYIRPAFSNFPSHAANPAAREWYA